MRIEVDTKNDSREELAALADMLQRLSRSSGSGAMIPKPVSRNIFDDPSPGVGLMNMFGDSQPAQQAASYSAQSQEAAPAQSGGLFSIFSDSTAQASAQTSSYSVPQSAEPERKTTAKDILDDDRIQLY
jgi:hypothetical protein